MKRRLLISSLSVVTAVTAAANPFECVSIVAVASTADPDYGLFGTMTTTTTTNGTSTLEQETFDCELPSGHVVPIVGTNAQLDALRGYLNSGVLVSGESTLSDLTVDASDTTTTSPIELLSQVLHPVATLPTTPWNFTLSSHRQRTTTTTRHRHLATYEGSKKVLVVRITDQNGLVNPDSPHVMSNKVFGTDGDTYTLSSQFKACSYGKLSISHQYGVTLPTSAPGVVDVTVPVDIQTNPISSLKNAFKVATEAKLGRSLPGIFDHVMYVVEKCYVSCGWAGFATVNGWMSVYQSHHYASMAVGLHEIGHNLNLAHSGGLDGKEYTDHSCLMGNPWFKDDRGQMCFNPAKTWQIAAAGAWYDTKYMYTWESGISEPNLWNGNLVGIADYDSISQNKALVVKLETGEATDYFVGFNRAYRINIDSKKSNDMVTIIQTGNNGKGYSKSVMIAELSSGQSHTFNNWRGSGKTLVVKVRNIDQTVNPWVADVELNFNNAVVPTKSPTKRPTASPDTTPTKSPTNKPTSSPNTEIPTDTPTTTVSPTKACGDMVCALYETNVDCPEDCSNVEFATYSDTIGAKSANGTMFSVQALRDVAVTSMSTFFRSTSEGLVKVYTKSGTYAGFEANETAWTLIYDNTISQNGKDVLTQLGSFVNNTKVVIGKGEVQSFYVYSPSNMAYRQEPGLLEGDLVLSDNSLNFYAGIAIAFGFFDEGQRYSPREFSGILRYDGIPAPNVACYTLDTQEACQQNARCAWLAFTSRCRRNRAVNGKTSKRLRKQ